MIDQDDSAYEAAHWFAAQRRGAMTLEETFKFNAWRANDANQRALDRMHELWGELSALKSGAPSFRRQRHSVRLAAAAAAVVVALGVAAQLAMPRAALANVQTGIGEQRSILLSDGSWIALNVVTQLAYSPKSSTRYAKLDFGEAEFVIKEEQNRPFIVNAGAFTIRTNGADFNILRREESDISVRAGAVEIRIASSSQPITLTAGQHIHLSSPSSGVASTLSSLPVETVGEWRTHVVDYDQASVADVVKDVNRYFPRQVTVTDPDLARREVTIRLQVKDRAQTLATLSALLGVRFVPGSSTDALSSAVVEPEPNKSVTAR